MTRENEIYKVTLLGSAANVALLVFKFVAGILGNSAAMMADAVHSLSDFLTDIVVLLFVRVSAKPQDESHDYGHGKFETLATLLIGLALAAAAIGIIVSGAEKMVAWLQGETLVVPGKLALWAALISIAVKELVYQYTIVRGRKLNSPAMIANAWHHRSDALSSIGAAIGIGGAIFLGERWAVLDPLASIVVGAMLIKVAYELMKGSFGELTDESLTREEEQEIVDIIQSFPLVSEPHNLRTRHIGNRVAIEAHIRMDGSLSLNEAHQEASAIESRLRERFGKDTLVTIHMEPTKG
ncbi:MAG: cation transporter [Paludibacteraceae bacterium]|nr:cation transporter [Paludibacteraceae bacterium]